MAFIVPYNNFVADTVIDSEQIDTNFAAVATKINGQIGNAEFNAGDPLSITKLTAYSQRMQATLVSYPGSAGVGWQIAAGTNGIKAHYPLTNEGGTWKVDNCIWFCEDTGAGTGKFKVQLGSYNGVGNAWLSIADLIAETTIAQGGGAGPHTGNCGSVAITGSPYTIAWAAFPLSIALVCSVADATAVTVGPLVVEVSLKRAIEA